MNTILALTDFSDASTNALSFAAELSKRASAHLIIIHILKAGALEEEANNKLNSAISDLKKSYSDLNCDSSVTHGTLVTALKKIIAVQQPDLIVMGTKGASGLKEILIGSNTVNVIAKTKVPVLVIPEVARFENFLRKGKNRILLATDLDELKNKNAINILKEIALLIVEPNVRVLNVRPKNTRLSDKKEIERDKLLSLFNPELESERVTVFSDNVIGGINFYLSEKNTDTGLLSMIARDSGFLIQRHFTREMASHTHLPLLVLHDTKI